MTETKSKSIEKVRKPEATPAHVVAGIRQRAVTSPQICGAFGVQSAAGNLAVQRFARQATGSAPTPAAGVIQTKLAINKPGDEYEQEAERVSEQVMRMSEPQLQCACACGGACPKCQTEQLGAEHESLQKKRVQASDTGQIVSSPMVHEVLRSPGQPLDPATRAFMEPRFGHDFSQVRVHSDADAEQSAREVSANAYTAGHNMVFGAGRFSPGTHEGRRLIAHELTHVTQQGQGAFAVALQGNASAEGPVLLQRTPVGGKTTPPARPKPSVDPRAEPGANDPLIQVPEKGAPVIEVVSEGARFIDWSWEVQRPGNNREQIYWAHFEVDANGVMTVGARMVLSSGQFRVPEWTLRGKFREALDIFSAGGVEVRAFDAEWGYMGPQEISSNLDAFFGSLRANPGQKLDQAAQATPSGKVAIENGFTEVTVQDIGFGVGGEHLKPPQQRIKHMRPGVRVRFAKPGTGEIPEESTGEPPASATGGQTAPFPMPSPPGESTAGRGRSIGMRGIAGGLGLFLVVSTFVESIGQVYSAQRAQIAEGYAIIEFWKRFGGFRSSAIWDNWHQVALPKDAEPNISAITSDSFPYVVDIDVEAFKRKLPTQIHNYQDFALFLDLGKAIWAINEEPEMPAYPSAEERRKQREYWAPVAWPDRNNRHRYDITHIIAEVRDRTLGELDASMRAQLRGLPLDQQNNIFRLKSGSETSLFRSAKGGQPIVSSQRLLGSDPWVRPIGRHVEGGVWSTFSSRHGTYRDRELVVPANADAERAALVSSYVIYRSLEDTLEEVRSGGRPILERTPPDGTLQSFMAGPEPGEGSRFGETSYYRHPDPDHNDWTVAIGELRQFWVNARELEPVTRTDVEAYTQRTGAAPSSP